MEWPVKRGMDPAVEEVNVLAGVTGRKLRLTMRDDTANPSDECVPPRSCCRRNTWVC